MAQLYNWIYLVCRCFNFLIAKGGLSAVSVKEV